MPSCDRRQRHPDRVRRRCRTQADPPRAGTGRPLLSPTHASSPHAHDTVWYAAYGSNLDLDRFRCYLQGGRPPGAARTYPGCRDGGDPLDDRPFTMAGRLTFAWESMTWGGGVAFHEPDVPGEVLARAYLLTVRQLADVLEQEMGRHPGTDHDLGQVLVERRHTLGPGRYETLHLVGEIDEVPVVSFGTPDVESLGINAPAPAYAAVMARGLRDAHGLTDAEVEDYFATCRGYA